MQKLLHGLLAAREVQPVLAQIQKALLRQLNGRCCDDRGGVIDGDMAFKRYRHTRIVIRAAQVIYIQALRQLIPVDAPVGEQRRLAEQLDRLIFFSDFVLIVEPGVGDLMDGGADRLYLAHAFSEDDALFVHGEVTVHILRQLLKEDGDGRAAAQSFHKHLVILHIPRKVRRQLRQGLACCLAHIKNRNRLVHRNPDFFLFHDGFTVSIQHGELGVGVELCFFNFLLEGRGGDDLNALFALFDASSELIAPFVEAGHMGGVGALHIDEHGVVDAVAVKAAHGGKVLPVSVALKQLLYARLDAVGDVLEPFLVGLFFSHFVHTSFESW